ncbi:hypothetical protein FHG87_014451 [Trinorchestia longiramus]|nr:hypothetical protein FHG87_014451 [Trinorchestia longiramus]
MHGVLTIICSVSWARNTRYSQNSNHTLGCQECLTLEASCKCSDYCSLCQQIEGVEDSPRQGVEDSPRQGVEDSPRQGVEDSPRQGVSTCREGQDPDRFTGKLHVAW